jgi:hypothetical protein
VYHQLRELGSFRFGPNKTKIWDELNPASAVEPMASASEGRGWS